MGEETKGRTRRRLSTVSVAIVLVLSVTTVTVADYHEDKCNEEGGEQYGESDCSGAVKPDPEIGELHECRNSDGDEVYFEIIDVALGDNYDVWVLEEVGGADVRVGFDNHVVESEKSTTIGVQTTYYDENRGDWFGEVYRDVTQNDQTGICGYAPYDTKGTLDDPADVHVQVDFSGMDVTVSEAESETVTHSEWSETTWGWSFEATVEDDGGEVTNEFSAEHSYGEMTTTSWTASSEVTWQSSRHTFQQDYQIP